MLDTSRVIFATVAFGLSPVLLANDAAPSSEAETQSPFIDPEDGAFDVSGFLSTPAGFLPVAVPITEPAVGYGLSLGLTFFHNRPKVVPSGGGGGSRVIMPSTTVLFGAGTENGSWGTGFGHLGVWNDGRIRYLGAIGYASLNLDWYGKGASFGDRSISYNNDVFFLLQRLKLQIGDSNFSIGPQYRLIASDAQFDLSGLPLDVPSDEFESRTAGLGLTLGYDSRDHPFSPTRGLRGEVTYSQQSEAMGGDFDYGQLSTYVIGYIPLSDRFVLGVNASGMFNNGDAPFYDLPALDFRGLERGRYVDDTAVSVETELRYDFTKRWTAVGFVGAGWIGDSLDDLSDASTQWAGGTGFRYLIARKYGLRMGADVAYGDDDLTLYITVGTGWPRP